MGHRRLAAALASVGLVLLLSATPAGAEAILGLTAANQLVFFNSDFPPQILRTVPVTGLQPGENLLAIDFRPATGQLYGLGSTSRLYVVDPTTGAASQVGAGPFTPALSGAFFGFDFAAPGDALRIVSDTGQNLRLNPTPTAVADNLLAYPMGDPSFGTAPDVVALAYTNNFENAVATTLYGIDSGTNTLVRVGGPEGFPSANGGQLTTVGPLFVNPSPVAGFDIAPGTGRAYAALTVGGVAQLYLINLGQGIAQLIGNIGSGLTIRDIAVLAFQRVLVTGAGAGGGPHVQVFDAVTGTVKFSFFPFPGTFTGGVRVVGCDATGDGVPDIVAAAGPGGGPHVRVFDGITGGEVLSFFAFGGSFTSGIFVGCADLNFDNRGDIIVGAGAGGGPHVRAFSGFGGSQIPGPLGSFFPYAPAFTGGVFVGGGQ